MKNTLSIFILMGFLTIPLCASDVPSKFTVDRESTVSAQQEFDTDKAQLPTSLKAFVTDFGTWPKDERAKISIIGLSFMISDLSKERHAPYEGSIGFWIDCCAQTQAQRVVLINCVKYLQK